MPRGEGIKPISSLFAKYQKNLVAPQGSVKKCVVEVIADLYGFKIDLKDMDYSVHNKTLTLKVRGPLKTEILLRKEEILTHLKGRLGERAAPVTIL